MKKLIAIAATSIAITVLGAGTATADHCTAPGDHAQSTAGPDHNEGEHQGWSTCVEQSNSDNENSNRGGNR